MDSGRKLHSNSSNSNRDSSIEEDKEHDFQTKKILRKQTESNISNNEESSNAYGNNSSKNKIKSKPIENDKSHLVLNLKVDVSTSKEDVATKRELLK